MVLFPSPKKGLLKIKWASKEDAKGYMNQASLLARLAECLLGTTPPPIYRHVFVPFWFLAVFFRENNFHLLTVSLQEKKEHMSTGDRTFLKPSCQQVKINLFFSKRKTGKVGILSQRAVQGVPKPR